MKCIIYITLFLISCGVQSSIESPKPKESSIIGKWTVTSKRAERTPRSENLPEDGYGSFYVLFGTYWGKSNNKVFNLQKDGQVKTNVIDSNFTSQIDMRYKLINDSLIEFSCRFPKDTVRNIMPVKYAINDNIMTWILDNWFEVKLKKE